MIYCRYSMLLNIRCSVRSHTILSQRFGSIARQAFLRGVENHKSRIQRVSRLIRCHMYACRSAVPCMPALLCEQRNQNPTPVRSPMSSSVCPNAILCCMQQCCRHLCRVQSVQRACRSCKSEGRCACLRLLVSCLLGDSRCRAHAECLVCAVLVVCPVLFLARGRLPLFRLLYTNSTTTSISFTAAPLKCLRTFVASCSFETRRFSFRLAIVGDCRPIPGLTSRAWLSGDVKAAGVERLCETRYVFSSDSGVVLQAICTQVNL